MNQSLILTAKKEGVATLTINRPEKRNSLTPDLLQEMTAKLEEWAKDDSVRCVVLTGSGEKAFCGGFDVLSIPAGEAAKKPGAVNSVNPVGTALSAVKNFTYPTIAMLNGLAMGAGFNLAMCCDIRIAADHVRMGIPPAKLGLVYPPDGMMQVVEAIGMAQAREVFFTGLLYGPVDARAMGLVHHMVPACDLEKETYKMASEIAENAPLSLKGIKRILNMMATGKLNDKDMSEAFRLVAESFASEDAREGQLAFIEKRKPLFKGK